MSIIYKDKEYAGLYDLHRSIGQKSVVCVETFCSRIRSRRIKNNGELSDFDITQALFLSKKEYFSIYAKRRTEISVEGKNIVLENFYNKTDSSIISCGTFRQRVLSLIKRDMLDGDSLNDALSMDNSIWISFYGGGRKRNFIYEGDLCPKYCGKFFYSVASFLRTIGKYSEKAIIWSRLKKGWRLDDAISEPVLSIDERPGKIYLIENICTHEKYVGLTVMSLQNRWWHHLRTAVESMSNTPLHKSIREFGKDNFTIVCIEESLSQDILPEKEKYWIETLGTITPNGFNVLEGGQTGGGRRKKIIYEDVEYNSIVQATYVLSQKTGLPEHVVAKRLYANQKMPTRARRHSKHPDAGTNLWRRWKQLIRSTKLNIRNGEVADEWLEYDNFKNDTFKTFNPALCLTRKDETLPWGGQ
jgi:group I intron endonuclease